MYVSAGLVAAASKNIQRGNIETCCGRNAEYIEAVELSSA